MTKYCLILLAFLFAVSIGSYSQNPIKEYDIPKISDGMNLEIYGSPSVNFQKDNNDTAESNYGYEINLSASFTKWRFSPALDYTISAAVSGSAYSYPEPIIIEKNENFGRFAAFFHGAAVKYLIPKHFYLGLYSDALLHTQNHSSPLSFLTLSPFIGTGRITNAFVVNEASNIEKILLKRGYITKGLDKDTRTILNNLLDRRNLGEYYDKYRDNAEIQFFGDAEALLLNRGIISKPLNAAATMEIYQSLTNSKYILYPVFKGYQLQAEFTYFQSIRNPYREFDKALSLSAVYGHPLGLKTSAVLSCAIVFPVNGQYVNGFDPEFHSPVLLRERRSIRDFSDYIDPGIFVYSGLKYDYKTSVNVNVFHNFSQFAAIRGHFDLHGKKEKDTDPFFGFSTGVELQFYILSKLSMSVYANAQSSRTSSYLISSGGYITYYIF